MGRPSLTLWTAPLNPSDFDGSAYLSYRAMTEKNICVPEAIARRILVIRGHKVLLGNDLSELYGVEHRVLMQAVKRNLKRFPSDFMFQLTREEWKNLKSQFVTSRWGGIRSWLKMPNQKRRSVSQPKRKKLHTGKLRAAISDINSIIVLLCILIKINSYMSALPEAGLTSDHWRLQKDFFSRISPGSGSSYSTMPSCERRLKTCAPRQRASSKSCSKPWINCWTRKPSPRRRSGSLRKNNRAYTKQSVRMSQKASDQNSSHWTLEIWNYMPSPIRLFVPDHVWHLTHRCHNREFLIKHAYSKRHGA